MNKVLLVAFCLGAMNVVVQGQQVKTGKFCLQYYPQPVVESYVDSLVSYLTRELGGDTSVLDKTTEEYIEHFANQAKNKSKCVFFSEDTILIHEKVSQELSQAYMIISSENKLISRNLDGLVEQPYFLEGSAESGYTDFEVITDKTDTKLIEGFLCYRTEVVEFYYGPGEEQPKEKKYIMYVTDDIGVPGGFILGINMSRIIGCPLEIQEPLNSKVRISYQATSLKLSIPDGIFQSL